MRANNAIQELVEELAESLICKHDSISVAESVTGGYLQFLLSSSSSAQQFYQGGMTVFNAGQKTRHLQVNPIEAFPCNGVSEKIAIKMAKEVAASFCAEWGVSVTGFASLPKEEGEEDHPYCHFSVVHRGKLVATEQIITQLRDRTAIQIYFAEQILIRLVKIVQGRQD